MQGHEVQLRGAESWRGGGWGRTASAPPCGRVRAVWRRCPVPLFKVPACPTRATTRVAPTSPWNSKGCGFCSMEVVGRLGLEPRTNGLKARCSTN